MTVLSSCYFCGAATDARVEEYRLVTSSREPTTVSLCHSCRHKIEAVVASVTDDIVEFVPAEDDGESTTAGDESSGHSSSAADSVSKPTAGDWMSESAAEARSKSSEPPEITLNETPETDTSDTDDMTVNVQSTVSDAEPDREVDMESERSVDAESEERRSAESGAGSEPIASDDPRSGSDESEAAPSVERPATETYNQVVRLLQNREFPLDRAEFVSLATDAYGLGRDEVNRVLDYAIARDALAEREGQLRRPE